MIKLIIKTLGSATFVVAAIYYGAIMIREERSKLTTSDAICEMIRYVRDNIEHFMKPLPDIFASYRNDTLERIGFLSDVRENGLRDAQLDRYFGKNYVDGEVFAVLADFCGKIGGGYRDDEIRLCDYAIARIEKRTAKMKDDFSSKTKIYRTLPPLFALSILLIIM